MGGALAVLLLAGATSGCARMTPKPNLDVMGPGPFLNVRANDLAMTNASSHLGWSFAVPALGYALGGRERMRQSTWAWIAYSLVGESLFHAPDRPDPGYASEVRTDLVTRLTIPLAVLVVDALLGKPQTADGPSTPPIQDRRIERSLERAAGKSSPAQGAEAVARPLPPLLLESCAVVPQAQPPSAPGAKPRPALTLEVLEEARPGELTPAAPPGEAGTRATPTPAD